MDVQFLKEKLLEENRVADLLLSLGCHHIKQSSNMIQCCNIDGNNPTAVCVYLNENLTCINYTRQMLKSGQTRTTDIIDLVSFVRSCTFFQSLQWICNINGWDYYEEQEEIPYTLQVLHMITKMNKESITVDDVDNTPIKPIDEKVLSYYLPYGNYLFEQDGISLSTQKYFEMGYDPGSNRITIPVRDECGKLVGIKGRLFQKKIEEGQNKYLYLFNCNKSRILFGLYQNLDNIIKQGKVFVGESEKSVCQMYEMGYYGVATGGSKISQHQINMLTRLGVQIIFAYDKDIDEEKLKNIASMFVEGVPVYAIIDKENLLNEKESPSDNSEKWQQLITNNVYKIR